MRSKPLVRILTLALAPLLGTPAGADTTELKARPGGKVVIQYGSPMWQEAWEDQIVDGMIWRLGSNPPTTIETDAGLVFDDTIVFPGEYNLGIVCVGADAWDLVVHTDGLNWNNGPCAARTRFPVTWVEEKEAARRLLIEMKKGKEEHVFRIALGRRHLAKPFRTFAARTLKAKVGRHGFTSTYLLRTDLEQVAQQVAADEVCVARLESKSLRQPLRCFLRGGENIQLAVWPEGDGAPLFLEGQTGAPKTTSETLLHEVEGGRESAVLVFVVGETTYHFDLPVEPFDRHAGEAKAERDG